MSGRAVLTDAALVEIQRVRACAYRDADHRPQLACIRIAEGEAVASDSFSLALVASDAIECEGEVMLPAAWLPMVADRIDSHGSCVVQTDDTHTTTANRWTFAARHPFPGFDELLRHKRDGIEIGLTAFRSAIAAVTHLDGELLLARTMQGGIGVGADGEWGRTSLFRHPQPWEPLGFRRRFLQGALSCHEDEVVTLHRSTDDWPEPVGRFCISSSDALSIVMPVRFAIVPRVREA